MICNTMPNTISQEFFWDYGSLSTMRLAETRKLSQLLRYLFARDDRKNVDAEAASFQCAAY
jgi:hypothetical protein